MPNLKISAMPGLGVNAAPGDLLTIVDVSAPAASANKHETLNNLLSVITRGITDKALRFQTPGTAPAVSLAAQGAIYFDGSNFQISANGGAYAPLLSLSPQADHAVLIGPTTGGPTAPTWRGLALSDLPAIATDRLLGRVSPGSGDVEEITPGSGILTWLTTPTLSNFLAAIQFIAGTTGTNNWVFSDSPTLTTPRISQINVNSNRAVLSFVQSGNSVNYLQISNSVNIPSSTYGGPTIETIGTGTDINLWLKSKGDGNIDLSPGVTGRVTVSSLNANNPGIIIARNGLLFGAQVVIGGVTLSAPLTASGFYSLPLTDGTSGQAMITDGAGTLSWASFADFSPQADHAVLIGPTTGGPTAPTWRGLALSDLPAIATDRLLGRVSPGSGDVEEITPGSGILTWLTTPTLSNFLAAIQFIAGTTGTNNWVFSDSPTLTTPRISQINVNSNRAVLSFVQSGNSVNYLQISNSVNIPSSTYGGPTIETIGTGTDINLWLKSKGDGNIDLSPGVTGRVTVSSLDANNPGIIIARNGLLFGAQVVIGGVTLSAPLTASGFYTLPSSDGTAGQTLVTNGSGGLSWGSISATPAGTNGQIQYNSSGNFAGTSKVSYSDTNTVLTVTETSGLYDGINTSSVTQRALRATTTIGGTGTGIAASVTLVATPTANSTAASSALLNTATTGLGVAFNYGTLNGLQNSVQMRGTATLTNARGQIAQVQNTSTGTISNAIGARYEITNTSTGTISSAFGIQTDITIGGGTVTNGYGVYVSNVQATNSFGVFVNGSWTNVSNGGSTTWATSSDVRYKTDIVDYELGLAEILQYRPVRFTWNEKSPAAGKRKVGLIAQEAQLVDPSLVFNLPADEYYPDPLAMDAENITWQLVKAVQQLAARVTALETMETT